MAYDDSTEYPTGIAQGNLTNPLTPASAAYFTGNQSWAAGQQVKVSSIVANSTNASNGTAVSVEDAGGTPYFVFFVPPNGSFEFAHGFTATNGLQITGTSSNDVTVFFYDD